jgi:hypothetical protein
MLISNIKKTAVTVAAALTIVAAMCAGARAAQTISFWDFTQGDQGWKGNGFLQKAGVSAEGLKFKSLGLDPMMVSPELDYPAGKYVFATVKMKTDGDSDAAAYLGAKYDERARMRFAALPDGGWHEYSFFLKSTDAKQRLWIVPFSGGGKVTVAWVRVVNASAIEPPAGPKPARPAAGGKEAARVISGSVVFVQYGDSFDSFVVLAGSVEMASGSRADRIGLLNGNKPEWLDLSAAKFTVKKSGGALETAAELRDSGGAKWVFTRRVAPGRVEGALDVSEKITVDRDRDALHVPWLTLLPGLGTFGGGKKQALFAGLEYLADEPSSSEADLRGPQSDRRVPDKFRITFPLMALAAKGGYVGVVWEESADVAAVFDSPDRALGSGAHLMALWAPGVGARRRENDLYAFDSFPAAAGRPLGAKFTIIGGAGNSVAPAVRQYVAIKGLPEVPKLAGGLVGAVEMLAHGWLDSGIRAGGMWRHALSGGNNFPPQISAESAALMLQLANLTDDPALAERLWKGAEEALDRSRPQDPNYRSGVSHVRLPMEQMLFGNVGEFVKEYAAGQRHAADEFDARGIRHYAAAPGRLDYSSTHFADHASGFAAAALSPMLEAAWLSGDADLTKKALQLLDLQTALYKDAEPRGAQTWEIPLHTPDILASAYIVKSYALGYAITGKKEYLDQARYWAWTGVPFVYLRPPAPGGVGNYSTIAVYGATNWESPNWIGLPVQWCGLVYASALYQLARYDSAGPWERIAKGITATGLLMSYPVSDAASGGLLPDSYNLKPQTRNGPDINPGTVQSHIAELYGKGRLYDFTRLPRRGWHVSAPCEISGVKEDASAARFTAAGFGSGRYSVLVSLIGKKPRAVLVGGLPRGDVKYDPIAKLLIIDNLVGRAAITIEAK